VRLDAAPMPPSLAFYLRAIHWYDAVTLPFESHLDGLVTSVRRMVAAASKSDKIEAGRPTDEASNNLHTPLTSLVGRERDVAEIASLLESNRLVTVVGAGGIGKTRAALAVATGVLPRFADGVWLVELAPLVNGDYIPSTVAQAMRFPLPPAGDPVEGVVYVIRSRHTLLLFDNCEHLVEATGRVVAAILRDCPNVKILASSRQSLRIDGEETYRLPSLSLPTQRDRLQAADAKESAAIALFVERARSVEKSFALNDQNAIAIADICRRLDGIPLAIELAAARVQMLGPQRLLDHLDERFRLLTRGGRDALPRQQTLRALIDWSHDLLDDREQVLFRRLGIFVNGFTLEGAIAVGRDGFDEMAVIDELASLVDKSLVTAEPDGVALRYRLLESMRAYAAEKLESAGESTPIAARHLRHFLDRFTALRAQAEVTARSTELDAEFSREVEDLRAALDGGRSGPDLLAGARLLAEIRSSWTSLGLDGEGISRNEVYLANLADGDSLLKARLSVVLSSMLSYVGQDIYGFEVASRAVEHARSSDDAATLARALLEYAVGLARRGMLHEADAALTEAEAVPAVSPNLHLLLLNRRAYLSQLAGDLAKAASAHELLREELRSLGETRGERYTTLNLAEIEHARGQTANAICVARENLSAARAGNEKLLIARQLTNLAGYLLATDEVIEGSAAAREVIVELFEREPEHLFVTNAIEHLALAYALSGDANKAAVLEGYVASAYARSGFTREFTEQTTYARLTALLCRQLTPQELERLQAEGARLSSGASVAFASG
jgi:predicted ATPase